MSGKNSLKKKKFFFIQEFHFPSNLNTLQCDTKKVKIFFEFILKF